MQNVIAVAQKLNTTIVKTVEDDVTIFTISNKNSTAYNKKAYVEVFGNDFVAVVIFNKGAKINTECYSTTQQTINKAIALAVTALTAICL